MARPLRIEYGGAHYHVTSRGNERKAIFRDDTDRDEVRGQAVMGSEEFVEEMMMRGWRYTEPRYMASYLMRRYGLMGLREIGERVGLHFSAVGNAVQRVADNPTRTMAQSLREMDRRFKNQAS